MAGWILVVEWLSRFVLLGLLALSVWSVSIILERRKFLKGLNDKSNLKDIEVWIKQGNRNALTNWSKTSKDIRQGAIATLLERPSAQSMELAYSYYIGQQREILDRGLNILGTLGSTTPFVGLFGTILGIIVAFGALSTGQIDSQKVMYSLAEALILTAVGLAVAIPSVVAFNYFNSELGKFEQNLNSIKDLVIAHFAHEQSQTSSAEKR
ncbi:MAG: MotA/TolQ/ExbB proton channel family protein [Pseudobdellovibrionaceae bacterium]